MFTEFNREIQVSRLPETSYILDFYVGILMLQFRFYAPHARMWSTNVIFIVVKDTTFFGIFGDFG